MPDDGSGFKLGNFISSIAGGTKSGFPNLGAGLSYAANPRDRAQTNLGMETAPVAAQNELEHQRAVLAYHHNNPTLLPPEIMSALQQHALLGHQQAMTAGTQAQTGLTGAQTEREQVGTAGEKMLLENQRQALAKYQQEHPGDSAGYVQLLNQLRQGTAQASGAEAGARTAGVQAGAAEKTFGEHGTTPEIEMQREQLAQQGRQFGQQLGWQQKIDPLKAMMGYMGMSAMGDPEMRGEFKNYMQQFLGGPMSLQSGRAPGADIENRFMQGKGGTTPGTAPPKTQTNQQGTVPGDISSALSQFLDIGPNGQGLNFSPESVTRFQPQPSTNSGGSNPNASFGGIPLTHAAPGPMTPEQTQQTIRQMIQYLLQQRTQTQP